MKILKEELQFDKSSIQRLKFICEFAKVTPTFINGSIRKIEKTKVLEKTNWCDSTIVVKN